LSAFDRTIAVEPLGGGRYRACIDPAWAGPVSANGGVVAATMVRAAEAEMGGGPPPRMITAHYLERVPNGPSEIEVEVLRKGSRVAAAEARLHHGGKLACQTTIIYSAPRPQEIALLASAPQTPTPEQVPVLAGAVLESFPPLFRQVEMRPVFGGPDSFGNQDPVSGGWISIRGDDAPFDAARLCAICDLWWPALFGRMRRPGSMPTLQLTVHIRATAAVARPPVLARFQTRSLIEGHAEESAEIWSVDGVLLAESKQMALVPEERSAVW
jgi:acyl-CoA thioesterase